MSNYFFFDLFIIEEKIKFSLFVSFQYFLVFSLCLGMALAIIFS